MTAYNPDGPHSPDLTRQAAGELAELVRYLCYSARAGSGGLEYPSDAYDLLGELATTAGRMPQLLGQLASFMRAQSARHGLDDEYHSDAAQWARVVARDLDSLARVLEDVAHNLGRRQADLSGMSVKESADG